MIKKNGGIFGRNPTYNDVVVEGVLTLKEAQVFDNDITINGDLTVNGTETVINTVELNVDDKNITMGAVVAKVGLTSTSNITLGQFTVLIADTAGLVPGMTVTKTAGTGAFAAGAKIASVDSHYQITLDLAHTATGSITFDTGGATDFTADGGGITLKGLTDKFIKWVKSTAAWTFSDKIEAPDVTVTNLTASLPVFTDANKKLITQSQQNALNAIAGAVTAARFLRGDGTNVTLSAIQAADVPTLNQSTTGSAGSVKSNATTGVLQVAGPTAGTTRVMTTPDANFTAARTDAAQTFTGAQTFGNIKVDTNTISSTNTNGNVIIDPNGSGSVNIALASGGVTNINASIYQDTVLNLASASGSGGTQSRITLGDGDYQTGMLAAYGNVYGAGYGYGVMLASNTVNDTSLGGTFKYSGAARASRLWQQDGQHYLQYAASGTVGGTISWLTACNTTTSGNLAFPSGQGIDFSADAHASGMTSELLDDYEEGTWTPAVQGASPNGTYQTAAATYGTYVKIGKIVHINCYITLASSITGGGGAYMVISGLPFSKIANSFSSGAFGCNGIDFDADTMWATIQFTSTTFNTGSLYVSQIKDNGAAVDLPISAVAANDIMWFSLSYEAYGY